MSDPLKPVVLYVSHLSDLDWLSAVEFGRVDDSAGAGRWHPICDHAAFILSSDDGREIGFRVQSWSKVDPESGEFADAWSSDGPRFDAPVLGLRNVCAGEVMVAARAMFGEQQSLNRDYFHGTISAPTPELRIMGWWYCLQTGDFMAHYGLGTELHEAGQYRDAYRHLRYYAEINPDNSWAQCWLGTAAASIGERAEARAAYIRAIELENKGGEATDARKLLRGLDQDG